MEIQTDPTAIAKISDEAVENAAEDATEMAERLIYELKIFALDLKEKLEECSYALDALEHISQVIKAAKGTEEGYENNQEYIYFSEIARNFFKTSLPRDTYNAAFRFQEKANEILGYKIKMIFVVADKTGSPAMYEMTSEEVITSFSRYENSFKGSYTSSLNQIRDLINHQHLLPFSTEQNLEGINKTYKEAVYRYDCSRLHISKAPYLILWKDENGKWSKGVRVSNKGDIAEAYAAIIIKRKANQFSSKESRMENNIEKFANWIIQVDNISGLLQGDVTYKGIEYGIKAMDASTLGLRQIGKLADMVLNEKFDGKKTLQQIKKAIANGAKMSDLSYENLATKAQKKTGVNSRNSINNNVSKGLSDAVVKTMERYHITPEQLQKELKTKGGKEEQT